MCVIFVFDFIVVINISDAAFVNADFGILGNERAGVWRHLVCHQQEAEQGRDFRRAKWLRPHGQEVFVKVVAGAH